MAAIPEEAIARWGKHASVIGKLGGGNRSDVWAVEIDGQRNTLRLSRRSPEAFDWELDLVAFLSTNGVAVPSVMPTISGERRWGQFTVLSWINGRAPADEADWKLGASDLDRIHLLTSDWRQRPGFVSATDLLVHDAGGDIDLNLMPDQAVEACRRAWQPLLTEPTSAVHGDPRGNVLMTDAEVAFIDWDECRMDACVFDLADIPFATLPKARLETAQRAASAWEAASSWLLEPEYARRRLSEIM